MNKDAKKYQSKLARARGLGSVGEGAHHWLNERISAVLLIPLVLWVVWSVVQLHGAPYNVFTAWLEIPVNAFMLLTFIVICAYHAAAGLQVVIEDYVACHTSKLLMIIGVKVGFTLLAAVSVFSILKVVL